ncbi:SRPBCC family protein [Brevibacterium spongiae]|uniref:SRPBCC family protein n=1 Tax=Brevibacterium spongiae TaxID=2909672 RepID=A0ABY5ST61_9MICO|nr:SRPBCC family protein [Brevibacterium spongiae]UVI37510.1 SRPBCC family protein [Brevibacterium spongiae]
MSHEHVSRRAGESAPFHFADRWIVEAEPETVWAVLEDVEEWSRWWPGLTEAHRFGESLVPGARARILVRTPIGVTLRFVITLQEVDSPRYIRFSASGDLRGEGIWTLTRERGATRIDAQWCVTTIRALITMMRPVSGIMHALVMAAGERGLRRRLSGTAGD